MDLHARVIARIRLVLATFLSRLMRTRLAHRLFMPVVAPVQMWLFRVTGGRVNLSALLVPSLILYTTGAKSGLQRETPLMCFPEPCGTYLVSGSNWGRPGHPAWTSNLLANPSAAFTAGRRRQVATASLLSGDQREAAWAVLESQFPGYRDYEAVAGREIRIFRLTPVVHLAAVADLASAS